MQYIGLTPRWLFWIEQDSFHGKGLSESPWEAFRPQLTPSFKYVWRFPPFLLQQNQTCSLQIFTNDFSLVVSAHLSPCSLLGLQAAPGANSQPSPPSDKPTQSYLNPASPPLTSSPLIALNTPHPLPEDFGFPLSRYLAVQLPSHHSLALFSIITWF